MAHANGTPAPDAPSSSTASTSNVDNDSYVFDVFINHRGPDVKTTFATPLYESLCKHDLRVFLDKPELQRGENTTSQIESAIRTASVHVAIFSSRYAESRYCLEELAMMVKSKSTIIPVFYDVEPSELRRTRDKNGVYGQALFKHEEEKTFNSSTIEEWRNALFEASKIQGFHRETYYRGACTGVFQCLELIFELCNLPLVFRAKAFMGDIVEGVLKNVKRPLHVSEYPKGLQQKLKDFESRVSLQQESGKVRVIGIAGLGGVGKTTLAKEFFNRHRSNYKRSCFLFDIRENSLTTLQSYLLKDLTQQSEQIVIRSPEEGKGKLRRYLSSYHALIIFDDVDNIQQLDALLLPAKDVLNTGSLILVTSRNKDVLISSGIPETSIYGLTGLNPLHSKELFCSHAFGQSHPIVGFEKVVGEFLDVCHGLPLSLKVLGALVHGENDLKHWTDQLRKIIKILPGDIQRILRVSFDSLEEEEQHIFLDIACFFIGENSDTAIRIWDEGRLGFRKLEKRCLIEVDSENRIRMHDHLRDLGRYLAEEEPPGHELRLWHPPDNFLHNISGQSPVRGISLVHGNDPEQSFEEFLGSCNLSRLQLLMAEGDFVEWVLRVGQFRNLRYLRWQTCLKSSLSSSIPIKNLRVLYIEGEHLQTLWQDESQVPLQLRELYIDAPISKVPKSIGKMVHLEKIILSSSYLETLPDEFCYMHSLEHLELNGCQLTLLPDSVGRLTSLRSLHLTECSTLQALPDSVGKLTRLQKLKLRACSALQALPDAVGGLTSLQDLYLSSCSALQALPDAVGGLTSLQHLHLGGCSALQALPDAVGGLTSLQNLYLRGCSALQALPHGVGGLTSLQVLDLDGCFALQALPDAVGGLTSLRHLHLSGCSALQALPDAVGGLTSLRHLHLSGCSALQALPDAVGGLTSLRHLHLSGCSALQALPDAVGGLTSLRHLHLSGCSALQALPYAVGGLTSLRHLHLSGCSALQALPDAVGGLTSLRHLHLSGCSALQALPDAVGGLTSLRHLHLSGCSALQALPDAVGGLTSLRHLHLSGCSALQALPDAVGGLTSLQRLYLSRCSALQVLPDALGGLTSLQSLHLSGCSAVQALPDTVGGLTSLQSLNLSSCSALQALPDSMEKLTGLTDLYLSRCSALQALPDSVGSLTSLQSLCLSGCSALQTLPDSVGSLTSLQDLPLSGCSALQVLPDSVGSLTNLASLHLSWCSALQALPDSVGSLTSLEGIFLYGCSSLRALPDSVGRITSLRSLFLNRWSTLQALPDSVGSLTNLRRLDLSGCSTLKVLPDSMGNLKSLKILDLSGCSSLQGLPNAVRSLTSLENLDLSGCSTLQRFTDSVGSLPSLESLDLAGAPLCRRSQIE